MNWGFDYYKRKINQMSIGRGLLVCLCFFAMLIILLLEGSSFADGSGRVIRGQKGLFPHDVKNIHISAPSYKDIDGDKVFGAEKRRVYTGPNPLHNR
ncbi:hypothetical protein CASFOL_019419 [Castilleja foliolosa]|uniref:Uncharacterized protein n=1 Tax=Castilleja foliolosa TaxID=1961234 RepID=A0ABD3D877_9LAMI